MSETTEFDPTRNLILVAGEVRGPRGRTPLTLVLDDLGYSARDGEALTAVYSAVGMEQGYILRVDEFSSLGFTLPDFRIHVFDLPDRYNIDGLVGLSFLRRLNYEIRSAEGRIVAELLGP